jgi:hypothetical protein
MGSYTELTLECETFKDKTPFIMHGSLPIEENFGLPIPSHRTLCAVSCISVVEQGNINDFNIGFMFQVRDVNGHILSSENYIFNGARKTSEMSLYLPNNSSLEVKYLMHVGADNYSRSRITLQFRHE